MVNDTLYGFGTPEWDRLATIYHFTHDGLAEVLANYEEIGMPLGVNDNGVFAAAGENWDWAPGDDVTFIPWKLVHFFKSLWGGRINSEHCCDITSALVH